jgi:hypothetical protein
LAFAGFPWLFAALHLGFSWLFHAATLAFLGFLPAGSSDSLMCAAAATNEKSAGRLEQK